MTSICVVLIGANGIGRPKTCLHYALVDFQTIELFGSLSCGGWLRECEGSNATALAGWSVREFDFLDGSNSLRKVVL